MIRSKTMETGSKFILTDLQRASHCQNALRDFTGVGVIVPGGHAANCIFFDDFLSEGRIRQEKKETNFDEYNRKEFDVE